MNPLENQHANYQIALTLLHGIGAKKARILVDKLGSAEAVFHEKLTVLHGETGIGKTVLKAMKRDEALLEAEKQATYIEKNNIQTHFYLNKNYPRRLKQCDDAPLLLYSKGNFQPNPQRVVSVVGTRAATDYGKQLCQELIQTFISNDIQVISGMAYGIDICAHQACVKHNVQTIGVLGHGLDRIYPAVHRKIAEQLMENGGLLTEYIFGTQPDRENFPMRNRIVAGMADATIVIESKKTGGSLITAELANEYNRDVFAFPGNIGQVFSEGCNLLVQKQRANLLLDGKSFLKEMGWDQNNAEQQGIQRKCFVSLNEVEQRVCDYLSIPEGLHIDTLAMQMNIPVSQANVLLFHLEMNGIVKALPGKKFCLM
jgi:DNA processing protein